MSYCPKCGNKVSPEMSFCPKCGAALKMEKATPEAALPAPPRAEKREKGEKEEEREKREKGEKYEKREYGFIGPLVGGLILILLGLVFYLSLTIPIGWGALVAFIVIIFGIIIIVGIIYAAMMAPKRHPPT